MTLMFHALWSATKRTLGLWLIALVLLFAYLAYDTDFFTKAPSGWSDWGIAELRSVKK